MEGGGAAADTIMPSLGQSGPERPPYDGVRSLFYYNTEVQPGQTVGLHLFEPRYRILIKRAWEQPSRNRELIFLP